MRSLSQNDGMQNTPIHSPLQATVVQWLVQPGSTFKQGDVLVILEAMKMEHEIHALSDGCVTALNFAVGDLVNENELLLQTARATGLSRALQALIGSNAVLDAGSSSTDVTIRPDLQRVLDRHAHTLDANRPEAMAKRHATGMRSARENIADLCNDGSFIEYGALAIAAQTRRRALDDLVANTPADGLIRAWRGRRW